MSLYGVLRTVYRSIVPKSIRHAIYVTSPLPLKKIRVHMIRTLEALAKHDEIYDADYFNEIIDPYMSKSCDTIAESIMDEFSPKSVVDVGCGSGLLLLALQKRGVSCLGLEYSEAALGISRRRGAQVIKFDLEHDTLPFDCRGDIVISTEVAEHLPESCADRFVDILCAIAETVILTASEPKSNLARFRFGTDHVNEQPKEYWIEKFKSHGFKYEQDRSMRWHKDWENRSVAEFLYETVMVFHKRRKSLPTNDRGRG